MELIERPGYSGKRKKERHEEWDKRFGKGKWRFIWSWGDILIDFEQACLIYEDAYFQDSFKREKLWKSLFSIASDFYDNAETNVNSRLDYNIQEAISTHIQDIAVRRVGIRRGWKCSGSRLVQIRGKESEGFHLMPGVVEFHLPRMIEKPYIQPKWASPTSVESFYQNNKWLAIE